MEMGDAVEGGRECEAAGRVGVGLARMIPWVRDSWLVQFITNG